MMSPQENGLVARPRATLHRLMSSQDRVKLLNLPPHYSRRSMLVHMSQRLPDTMILRRLSLTGMSSILGKRIVIADCDKVP